MSANLCSIGLTAAAFVLVRLASFAASLASVVEGPYSDHFLPAGEAAEGVERHLEVVR